MAFGESNLIRGMAFGESNLIRGVAFGESNLIRGVAFGERTKEMVPQDLSSDFPNTYLVS
jgi:hypothetical protein